MSCRDLECVDRNPSLRASPRDSKTAFTRRRLKPSFRQPFAYGFATNSDSTRVRLGKPSAGIRAQFVASSHSFFAMEKRPSLDVVAAERAVVADSTRKTKPASSRHFSDAAPPVKKLQLMR